MKKAILIIFGLLLVFGPLAAQDWKGKGRVMGTVLDEQDVPLEGVKIKFTNVANNAGIEVLSDKDGRFLGAWLRKGAWNVDFEKAGYEVKKIAIEVSEVAKNPEIKMNLKKIEGLHVTDEIKEELGAANALFAQGSYPEALTGYNAILEKNPEAYILWKNVGNCYFAMEQYDKAEEAYRKILEKDDKNSDAMLNIGNTFANRNESDKALEWYNKIDIALIDDSTVLFNIGTNYYNLGKFDQALTYYQAAVKIQESNLDAIYQLGLTFLNLQRNDEAVAAFESFLKIDSESEKSAQVKGFLEYLRKR